MSLRRFARARVQARPENVLDGEVIGDALHTADGAFPLSALELLAPAQPSKIVAVALNYRAHAAEMKKPVPEEPLFFTKPTTAIIGPNQTIRLPAASAEVHFEGELGVVIGRTLSRATPEQAKDAIRGLTCVNDVTARDIQRRQNHYTRAKGYDTFCPIGPFVVTGLDPTDLRVQTRVNGQVKQSGRTSDMIFGTYELLSFISHVMTLLPGDVVSTGTPPGVGPIKDGDTVEIEIEGIGVLSNRVASAQ